MENEDNRPFKLKVPKDMPDYILKSLAKESYLIYSRKDDICFCTRCKKKMKISQTSILPIEFEHNKTDFCPNCRCDVTMKAFGRGRKNIEDCGRVLWLTKHGRNTYAELDEYKIRYDGYYSPKIDWWPSAQYKFNSDEQIYYENDYSYYVGNYRWQKRKNVILPNAPSGSGYYESPFAYTMFYEPSRNNLGTDLKYADMNMYRLGYEGRFHEAYWILYYINLFCRYQSIELLEKAGYEKIVGGRVEGIKCKYINWRGKTIKKILKLNNEDLKYVRENKLTIVNFNQLMAVRSDMPFIKISEADKYIGYISSYDYKDNMECIGKYAKREKILTYMKSHGISHMRDYADYIKACEQLGEKMNKSSVIFPPNFQTAHAEVTDRLDVKVNSDKREKFIRSEARITGMTEPYVYGSYMIRPAKSPTELRRESAVLAHCVKTYIDRVAGGETAILFIRKVDKPEEPLYTLELNAHHKMVQCRGLHNCSYGDDVKEFIDHWMQDVIEKKKKKPARKAA